MIDINSIVCWTMRRKTWNTVCILLWRVKYKYECPSFLMGEKKIMYWVCVSFPISFFHIYVSMDNQYFSICVARAIFWNKYYRNENILKCVSKFTSRTNDLFITSILKYHLFDKSVLVLIYQNKLDHFIASCLW